jgi:hypothetical protein
MKKKTLTVLFSLISIVFLFVIINRFYPYLRTDIFRTFAKGNWNMTSENDTLYAVGYFGVRKYLADNPENLKLLAENDEFCKDRMFGRDVCVYNEYLFLTTRSFLPGSIKKDKINGQLLVLRKKDLSIVKGFKFEKKLVEVKTIGNILVTSSLGGFSIYNIATPISPNLIFSYNHSEYREYQGFDFIVNSGKVYVAFSLFGEGLEIWNITKPEKPNLVCNIPISNGIDTKNQLSSLQSMDLDVSYPYVYATLGPSSDAFRSLNDNRGLLVYDISDINNIKKDVVFIPKTDWYRKSTGDKQPTYITRYKDKLYLNFAEKGVAIFDINDGGKPIYKGLIDVSGNGSLIQPVFATKKGILFTGSYYCSKVYGKKL